MSKSDDEDGIFGFPTIFVILIVIFFWGDPDIHDKTMAWIDRQDGKSCERLADNTSSLVEQVQELTGVDSTEETVVEAEQNLAPVTEPVENKPIGAPAD